MAAYRQRKAFSRIAEVRSLQQKRALVSAADAAARIGRIEEQRARATESLKAASGDWERLLGQPSLDLGLVRLGAQLVLQGSARVQEQDDRLATAKEEREECERALKLAVAQCDVAIALEKRAHRDLLRHQDEAALGAVEDRFTARRAR